MEWILDAFQKVRALLLPTFSLNQTIKSEIPSHFLTADRQKEGGLPLCAELAEETRPCRWTQDAPLEGRGIPIVHRLQDMHLKMIFRVTCSKNCHDDVLVSNSCHTYTGYTHTGSGDTHVFLRSIQRRECECRLFSFLCHLLLGSKCSLLELMTYMDIKLYEPQTGI